MKWLTGFFFSFLFLFGCTTSETSSEISILWRDEQAIGILIPISPTDRIKDNHVADEVSVRLKESPHGIFGDFKIENNTIVFTPLIPFTRGFTYRIYRKEKLIGSIEIPLPDISDAPRVSAIYPSADTLPENTLKLYFTFSKPMRQGEALNHITLLKNNTDTVKNAFLNLKPELWNADGTILTLWFDPGRVKRDLQPNKRLGAPLQNAEHYTLVVSSDWKDTRGAALHLAHIKSFTTFGRDSESPKPDQWKIIPPAAETKDSLRILLNESLDYLLLRSAVLITDKHGDEIKGVIKTKEDETELIFYPEVRWPTGTYFLMVENRLEDLAGNNLERPFDRDLDLPEVQRPSGALYKRQFRIE